MVHCAAFNCPNDSRTSKGVAFFNFPKNIEKRKEWLESLRLEDFVVTHHSRLCQLHFLPVCFERSPEFLKSLGLEKFLRLRLEPEAVPTEMIGSPTVKKTRGESKGNLTSSLAKTIAKCKIICQQQAKLSPNKANGPGQGQGKKREKRKRIKGVGKGSLWCIDNEYRQNLLQGLRKNQVLAAWRNNDNPFGYTPPSSPGNSLNSSTPHLVESWHSRVDSPFFDDKEFDAAASLCTMSTPKEWRAVEHERFRSHTKSPTEMCSTPTVLDRWRTYIEPFSDDDDESNSNSSCKLSKSGKLASSNGRKYTIANILADVGNRSFNRSLKRLRYDDSVDEGFEFNRDSDEDDISDEEIENNMKKLVERDSLEDSGYSEKGRFALMLDHTYFKTPKRVKHRSDARRHGNHGLNQSIDSDVSLEVEALLSLANAATKQLEQLQGQKIKESLLSF